MSTIHFLAVSAAVLWSIVLLLPWFSWRNREVLDVSRPNKDCSLEDITVVIPARNEADVIATTLHALKFQGEDLKVVLVNDGSLDGTSEVAKNAGYGALTVVDGAALPAGWSGKLWAQEQGIQRVTTPLTLLLDADIELAPGVIATLLEKKQNKNVEFISLMASPHLVNFWEKALMPTFIHFFKMLYPFHLANNRESRMAAAAGGCILMETGLFKEIGGLSVIRDAIIDDCTLAKTVKSKGYATWTGLSHSVKSQRPYKNLGEIWDMVARTAFTQLYYSIGLLLVCTLVMMLLYIVPLVGLLEGETQEIRLISLLALLLMGISYLPTLLFYRRNLLWVFSLPAVACLYLAMTWSSAIRYWRGERSRWKGRIYSHRS
ncbi:MAG: glycosyltransferase [Methylococcales bacterium]